MMLPLSLLRFEVYTFMCSIFISRVCVCVELSKSPVASSGKRTEFTDLLVRVN